ncbi:TPA: hypothetical protein ACK41A_002240, partial [Neisseria gonorrhoeae]
PSESVPYYLYCLRLPRLVLIFVNPLYQERQKTFRRHSRAGGNPIRWDFATSNQSANRNPVIPAQS